METMSGRHNALELELKILVVVGLGMHFVAPRFREAGEPSTLAGLK
jgi:hypothetical protein